MIASSERRGTASKTVSTWARQSAAVPAIAKRRTSSTGTSAAASCTAAREGVDGPAFTSIFQGATRWQTYVALAVSGNLFGDTGLALASVAMVAIIPLVNVFSVAVLAHVR